MLNGFMDEMIEKSMLDEQMVALTDGTIIGWSIDCLSDWMDGNMNVWFIDDIEG